MDAEFRKDLFHDARNKVESARRWGWIIVAVLAAFQAFTLFPYLRVQQTVAATEHDQDRLAEVRDRVAGLGEQITALRTQALADLRHGLEELLQRKREQLQALSAAVQRIRTGEEVGENAAAATMTLQVPPGVGFGMPAVQFDIDDRTRDRLRRARDNAEVRELLAPIVEQQIIGPGFNRLSGRWRRTQAQLGVGANAIRASLIVERAALADPPGAAWTRTEAALDGLLEAAAQVRFSPPTDRFWWTTEVNKRVVLFELGDRAERSLGQADSLQRLELELKKAGAGQERLLAELREELQRLESAFDAQKKQLERYVGGAAALPVQIDTVVVLFPWILAVVLPGWWLQQARCVLRLARVAAVMPDGDAVRAVLRGMLGDPLWALAGTLAGAVLGIGWLVFTSDQIGDYQPVPAWHGVSALYAGATAAVLASVAKVRANIAAARAVPHATTGDALASRDAG